MKWQNILTAAVLVAAAVNVYAGIMYLELPDDMSAAAVLSPTPEDEVVIEDFVISEVNKIDKDWADRVVVL